jgi:hypothetical protein
VQHSRAFGSRAKLARQSDSSHFVSIIVENLPAD